MTLNVCSMILYLSLLLGQSLCTDARNYFHTHTQKKEKRKPITVPYKENEAIAIGKLQMCSTMIVLTFVEREIL